MGFSYRSQRALSTLEPVQEPKLKALALESIYHLLLKHLAVKNMVAFGEECVKILEHLFIQPTKEKKKGKLSSMGIQFHLCIAKARIM